MKFKHPNHGTVPVMTMSVPDAGKMLADLTPIASYRAAQRGDIQTIAISSRTKRVSCAWVAAKLAGEVE